MAIRWMRAAIFVAIVSIANLLALNQLGGSAASEAADASRGLDGVLVSSELTAEAAADLHVNSSEIEECVDRRLRAGSVRNLSREESVRQGAATLQVAIQSIQVRVIGRFKTGHGCAG